MQFSQKLNNEALNIRDEIGVELVISVYFFLVIFENKLMHLSVEFMCVFYHFS